MKQLLHIMPALFILLILLGACTERVSIDLEESDGSMLVVFGEITDEVKAHAIYLSRSVSYFYNEATPVVSGAIVSLSDGTTTVSLSEDPEDPGTYLTPDDYAGIPGNAYKLLIENVDINNDGISETYTAETVMKNTIPVEQVLVVYNSSWKNWEVGLFAKDPGETRDFYLYKVYRNGVLYTDSISDYRTSKDEFYNGNRIKGATVQYFDKEEGDTILSGDKITLEVAGITEDYYDFINQVQDEINDKIPLFSGPSANIEGNISNGALGFFSVMAISRGSCTYYGEGE